MAKRQLRKFGLQGRLNLEEDGAGNLYWRGRRLTAAAFTRAFLAAALIGVVCDLIKTIIDVGGAAGWWP